MYGAVIGDIAGSRHEFAPIKKKDFRLFHRKCRVTDDSVMTIAAAEVLLKDFGTWDDERFVKEFTESYRAWGNKYPRAGYGGRFRQWLGEDSPEAYGSYGNGSAMRVSAAGWAADSLEETRRLARLTALPTHDHPEGIKGAEAAAAAIFMARKGSGKDDIREYVEEEFGYDLCRSLDEIRPGYSFDVTCQGSVPEAIIAFLEGRDYEDTVRNAVSLGGDSDTQAAIAGAIAEAYFGIPGQIIYEAKEFIPEDMQEVIDAFRDKFMDQD